MADACRKRIIYFRVQLQTEEPDFQHNCRQAMQTPRDTRDVFECCTRPAWEAASYIACSPFARKHAQLQTGVVGTMGFIECIWVSHTPCLEAASYIACPSVLESMHNCRQATQTPGTQRTTHGVPAPTPFQLCMSELHHQQKGSQLLDECGILPVQQPPAPPAAHARRGPPPPTAVWPWSARLLVPGTSPANPLHLVAAIARLCSPPALGDGTEGGGGRWASSYARGGSTHPPGPSPP
eukprot:989753-Pelagomonas_calceolata.AAC.2